ncbi:MAG TPA: hypothetical protein VM661_10020 [Candidatus Sulfotelmatobacter sp.]|jgi:hypothetical protein|nr:hypothetical protein [Candidatus Sulfotelmatobacter sp.]
MSKPNNTTSRVIDEIYSERRRQVDAEGYSARHDDKHPGQMAAAAACYAIRSSEDVSLEIRRDTITTLWPWEISAYKPKDTRRDLIRAAALIVAEIERMDRIAS